VVPALVTLASFLLEDFRKQLALLVASLALQMLATIPVNSALPPAYGATPAICELI